MNQPAPQWGVDSCNRWRPHIVRRIHSSMSDPDVDLVRHQVADYPHTSYDVLGEYVEGVGFPGQSTDFSSHVRNF